MQENQNLVNDLDFRVDADFFVPHDRDELAPTSEVGVTHYLPVLHASFSVIAELEKKRRFVNRRNILSPQMPSTWAVRFLRYSGHPHTHSNRWKPSNAREVFSNGKEFT